MDNKIQIELSNGRKMFLNGKIDRIDIAFIVCDYSGISDFEKSLVNEFQKRNN